MTILPYVIKSSNTFLLSRVTSCLKGNLNLSIKSFLSSNKTPVLNMDKLQVVPDVIDKAPEAELQVTYEGGVTVQVGGVLTPTQVKNKPQVHYIGDPKAFYLLCMTDPDAPSRKNPLAREWHHWLVGNIPGNNVSAGEVLSDYIGAGPPEDTGLHRYVFLVYKQPSKLTFDEARLTNRSGDGRAKFSINNFSQKYKLGEPIAGNVFQAEWDTYVPELYKQLGG